MSEFKDENENVKTSAVKYLDTVTPVGFWKRLGAYCVDGLIDLVVIVLVMKLEGMFFKKAEYFLLCCFINIIYFCCSCIFKILFNIKLGGTPGKLLCRLRIVRSADGNNLNWRNAIRRQLIYLIIFTLNYCMIFYFHYSFQKYGKILSMSGTFDIMKGNPVRFIYSFLNSCINIADIIICLASEKHRALHDLIAGSVVICNEKNIHKSITNIN